MKIAAWLSFAAGLTLFAGVLIQQDIGKVFAVLSLAGWWLALSVLTYVLVYALDAMSWRSLLGVNESPSLFELTRMWWIGSSVNTLLPVVQVGGDLVRARLLAKRGTPGPVAGASVVVGLTASVLSLLLFAAAGGILLASMLGPEDEGAATPIAAGLAVFAALFFGFYLAQRRGMFLWLARALERLARGSEWQALIGGASALDAAIVSMYGNRRAFLACCVWRLLGWTAGTLEVWLALYFLGHPSSFALAFVIESLGQAIRSAGFAIPGALGVQEGGLLGLGILLGVPGEVALSISLVKRAREILVGLPGLAAWQYAEFGRISGTK